MRAIIIDDKDARALLDSLKLESFSKMGEHIIGRMDVDKLTPTVLRDEIVEEVHRRFHFIVVRWLQDQGANLVR